MTKGIEIFGFKWAGNDVVNGDANTTKILIQDRDILDEGGRYMGTIRMVHDFTGKEPKYRKPIFFKRNDLNIGDQYKEAVPGQATSEQIDNYFQIYPLGRKMRLKMIKHQPNTQRLEVKKRTIILFCMVVFSELSLAQEIKVYLQAPLDPCGRTEIYYSYFGVPNRLLITSEHSLDLKRYTLRSDSGRLERVNDSIFLLYPKYANVRYIIGVFDSVSNRQLYKLKTTSIWNFLSVTIFDEDYIMNSVYSFDELIAKRKKIRFAKINRGCLDYLIQFKLRSYTILLKRGDQKIVLGHVNGNHIRKALRKRIIKNAQNKDEFTITNIKAVGQDGRVVDVNEFRILVRK